MLTNIILAIGDSKSTIIEEIGDEKKKQGAKSTVIQENGDKKNKKNKKRASGQHGTEVRSSEESVGAAEGAPKKGMVLPFQPLSLHFNHMNYYVDVPDEMKGPGVKEDHFQLLKDVSGSFKPGMLIALMGNQATFALVSGYCEQNDIHSPYVTVYESLLYSVWLRLSSDIDSKARKVFVEEVMELIELEPLRDALVGLPGVEGLSTEQWKRLTIAVELVANPFIIFMDDAAAMEHMALEYMEGVSATSMDEPTSGLDVRAAMIVMRTVRNTMDTRRTVICTILQQSIDIFEAFDEAIQGVAKINDGYNPATWMLEVLAPSVEAQMGVYFAEIFAKYDLYLRNQELIKELSNPALDSKDLYFPTKYSQLFLTQCNACFWKQRRSYWRNCKYNVVQSKQQDLFNLLGAMYADVLFLGASNATSVQPVVNVERMVFYSERVAEMCSALPYAFA
ncbi:hypothetical protein LWI28_015571 [Acer negundo]|uniref:Uncharacterized protein n=1 Tax=Acer negundo TaxID=4023 RepID=A0AAD5NFI7_ACENE|nr:hypothetical protein LWI28_015571 [Acer negundo]